MRMSGQKGFEGWYFKHQKGDDMVAFIPGRAVSGDFIQLISREGARQFQVSDLTVRNGMIQADRCWFSSQGCHIELPGISGEIVYGPLAPLCSDIMGPFRFFPMECRHGVLSMAHTLQGSVRMDGQRNLFSPLLPVDAVQRFPERMFYHDLDRPYPLLRKFLPRMHLRDRVPR